MSGALIKVALSAWPFPNPPLEIGVEDGIAWAVVAGPCAGVNGYVLIPAEGHPWSAGIPYRENSGGWTEYAYEYLIEVHGGITYGGGSCMGSDARWLGFDTGHAGDVWDAEFDPYGICCRGVFSDRPSSWNKFWTFELVVEETKSLARQLAALPQVERSDVGSGL